MPFKGTDLDAWKKASKYKSKRKRKEVYYEEKEKNLAKKETKSKTTGGLTKGIKEIFTLLSNPKSSTPKTICENNETRKKSRKFKQKNTIFDYIRTYRSPKLISTFSNGLAITVTKLIPFEMSNNECNYVRSEIAFITSEVLNRIFEEEIKTVEKIKLFYKIGKNVYKITVYVNEKLNELDSKEFKRVSHLDISYRRFLRDNAQLKPLYSNDGTANCLTKEEIEKGKVCPRRALLEKIADIKKDIDTPNGCPYYNYCSKK